MPVWEGNPRRRDDTLAKAQQVVTFQRLVAISPRPLPLRVLRKGNATAIPDLIRSGLADALLDDRHR